MQIITLVPSENSTIWSLYKHYLLLVWNNEVHLLTINKIAHFALLFLCHGKFICMINLFNPDIIEKQISTL